MTELIVTGGIALLVFAILFYQAYQDKERWRRIVSGMSLFGSREDIPPLVLGGNSFEPHEKRVLLIWGNYKQTSFKTVSEAIQRLAKETDQVKLVDAKIFAWDGESWKQRR